MKLIGMNFSKMNIERKGESLANLKISTNIDISDISSVKNSLLKGKEEFVSVKFKYAVSYEPEIANLELTGNLLFSVEAKRAKQILKNWENKELDEDFRIPVFNIVLRKANIKALQLEDELNLPPHLPFPTMKRTEENK